MIGRVEAGQVYSSNDYPGTVWLVVGVTDTHFEAVYLCTQHHQVNVGKVFSAKLTVLANHMIVRIT